MAGVHEDRRNVPAGNQEAMTDIPRNRLFPEDVMPIRHSQDKGELHSHGIYLLPNCFKREHGRDHN